jgi:hypothetical protein
VALLPLVVSFMALFLHWDRLRGWLRFTGPAVFPELPVEVGHLLVELTSGLGNLIEACPALGVRGTVAWHGFCLY